MLVHIGEKIGVKSEEIIGFFDIEKTTRQEASRDFIVNAEKENITTYVSQKIPRSFVLTEAKGINRVFITQLTTDAIKDRIANGQCRGGINGKRGI